MSKTCCCAAARLTAWSWHHDSGLQGRRRFRQAQESKGEDHGGFERLRHPVDRNGRSVPNRYTTAELDEALGEYRTACDTASQAVRAKAARVGYYPVGVRTTSADFPPHVSSLAEMN